MADARSGRGGGGWGSMRAEAAVRDAEGLEGVEGDAMQSRRGGRVVVQGEGVFDLDVEG